MVDDLHVHHCPYCELGFRLANEVKDHVVHDHPDHAAAFALVEVHELPQGLKGPLALVAPTPRRGRWCHGCHRARHHC